MSSDLVDMTDVYRRRQSVDIRIPRIVWVKMHKTDNPGLMLYNTLSGHHDRITLGECEKITRLILSEYDHDGVVDLSLCHNTVDIYAQL